MPLADAYIAGWPAIAKERQSDHEPDSLGDLCRYMRNALSHGNVEFLSGASADISALRLWNIDRFGQRTWGAVVSVADMRSFLLRFVAVAEELCEREVKQRQQIA